MRTQKKKVYSKFNILPSSKEKSVFNLKKKTCVTFGDELWIPCIRVFVQFVGRLK